MCLFRGFGGWIDQTTQQLLDKVESKKSLGNVKYKPTSEINNNDEDSDEMKTQLKLWRDAEKNEPWHDAPPKVKVKMGNYQKEQFDYMDMEFTIGLPPQAAYDLLTYPNNKSFSKIIKGRQLLKNKWREVISTDERLGGQFVETENVLSGNFLLWSGTIPLRLYSLEDPKNRTVQYWISKEHKYIDMLMGKYKVEPIYIDSRRLCKNINEPKSREEYEKCSDGQGRIASKVKMEQHFMPYPPFNLPPLSWFVRKMSVNTTKTLIKDFQTQAKMIRGV